jgi:hypothetical protein
MARAIEVCGRQLELIALFLGAIFPWRLHVPAFCASTAADKVVDEKPPRQPLSPRGQARRSDEPRYRGFDKAKLTLREKSWRLRFGVRGHRGGRRVSNELQWQRSGRRC